MENTSEEQSSVKLEADGREVLGTWNPSEAPSNELAEPSSPNANTSGSCDDDCEHRESLDPANSFTYENGSCEAEFEYIDEQKVNDVENINDDGQLNNLSDGAAACRDRENQTSVGQNRGHFQNNTHSYTEGVDPDFRSMVVFEKKEDEPAVCEFEGSCKQPIEETYLLVNTSDEVNYESVLIPNIANAEPFTLVCKGEPDVCDSEGGCTQPIEETDLLVNSADNVNDDSVVIPNIANAEPCTWVCKTETQGCDWQLETMIDKQCLGEKDNPSRTTLSKDTSYTANEHDDKQLLNVGEADSNEKSILFNGNIDSYESNQVEKNNTVVDGEAIIAVKNDKTEGSENCKKGMPDKDEKQMSENDKKRMSDSSRDDLTTCKTDFATEEDNKSGVDMYIDKNNGQEMVSELKHEKINMVEKACECSNNTSDRKEAINPNIRQTENSGKTLQVSNNSSNETKNSGANLIQTESSPTENVMDGAHTEKTANRDENTRHASKHEPGRSGNLCIIETDVDSGCFDVTSKVDYENKKKDNKSNENTKEKKSWFKILKNAFTNDDYKHSSKSNHDGAYNSKLESAFEKFVYFWLKDDVFSQWHDSKFEVDGIKFCNAEQYMMYSKAAMFGDEYRVSMIMKTSDPRKIKANGRKVSNFNEPFWREQSLHVVKNGNLAKFSQNEKMKKALFETHPKILVEASPYDKIWGIGLYSDELDALDKSTWKGLNLLGYILTEVRDELMCNEGLIGPDQKQNYLEKMKKEYCEELNYTSSSQTEMYVTVSNTEVGTHQEVGNMGADVTVSGTRDQEAGDSGGLNLEIGAGGGIQHKSVENIDKSHASNDPSGTKDVDQAVVLHKNVANESIKDMKKDEPVKIITDGRCSSTKKHALVHSYGGKHDKHGQTSDSSHMHLEKHSIAGKQPAPHVNMVGYGFGDESSEHVPKPRAPDKGYKAKFNEKSSSSFVTASSNMMKKQKQETKSSNNSFDRVVVPSTASKKYEEEFPDLSGSKAQHKVEPCGKMNKKRKQKKKSHFSCWDHESLEESIELTKYTQVDTSLDSQHSCNTSKSSVHANATFEESGKTQINEEDQQSNMEASGTDGGCMNQHDLEAKGSEPEMVICDKEENGASNTSIKSNNSEKHQFEQERGHVFSSDNNNATGSVISEGLKVESLDNVEISKEDPGDKSDSENTGVEHENKRNYLLNAFQFEPSQTDVSDDGATCVQSSENYPVEAEKSVDNMGTKPKMAKQLPKHEPSDKYSKAKSGKNVPKVYPGTAKKITESNIKKMKKK